MNYKNLIIEVNENQSFDDIKSKLIKMGYNHISLHDGSSISEVTHFEAYSTSKLFSSYSDDVDTSEGFEIVKLKDL